MAAFDDTQQIPTLTMDPALQRRIEETTGIDLESLRNKWRGEAATQYDTFDPRGIEARKNNMANNLVSSEIEEPIVFDGKKCHVGGVKPLVTAEKPADEKRLEKCVPASVVLHCFWQFSPTVDKRMH